jgi:hypothetical protein
MSQFNPCRGKDYCTEEGTHCEGCGRSHEEIAATRELIGELADFALKMGYDNIEEFVNFVADKAVKKIRHVREQEEKGDIPLGN